MITDAESNIRQKWQNDNMKALYEMGVYYDKMI